MHQSRARRPPVETRSVVTDHLGFGRSTLTDTVGGSKTLIHMDGHEHIDVGTRSSGLGHGHVDGASDGAGRDGVDERLVAIDDPDADFAEQ